MKDKLTVHAFVAVLSFGVLGITQFFNIPLAIVAIAGLVMLSTDKRLPLGLLAGFISLVISLLIGGKILVLECLMMVIVPALILTVSIRTNKQPITAVFAVIAPVLVLIVIYFVNVGETQSFYKSIEPNFEVAFREMVDNYSIFNQNDSAKESSVEWSLKTLKMLIRFMPAFSLIIFTVIGACSYMLIDRGFKRENRYLIPFPSLSRWKISEFVMIFFGIGLLMVIACGGIIEDIGENIAMYTFALFSFGGLSLLEYVLRKKKAEVGMKVLVYVVIVVSQVIGAIILGIMGLIDSHFDFRRLKASRIG